MLRLLTIFLLCLISACTPVIKGTETLPKCSRIDHHGLPCVDNTGP